MGFTSYDAILILNPLRSTLRHYEQELISTLQLAGYSHVEVLPSIEGEGISSAAQRVRVAAASLLERVMLGFRLRRRTVIVVWPSFGYLDPWTLWMLCRTNRVLLIFHDPTPLRRTYGHSVRSRRVFKWIVEHTGIEIIYHTELAQRSGVEACGVVGKVIPHPVGAGSLTASPSGRHPVVRVLGQYKRTRTLEPLESIAANSADGVSLEVHGRHWPHVPGWSVSNRFVPEREFDALIRSSDCVVIPYDSFFQSGVAVRCLENGVPVVAPMHEHIVELYGADWPGLVKGGGDWPRAILDVLGSDRGQLGRQADAVRASVSRSWATALSG